MRHHAFATTLALAVALAAPARAEDAPATAPAEAPHVPRAHAHTHTHTGPCKEPDFDFLSSSPYTERAWEPKIVLATQMGVDHETRPEGSESVRDFATTVRLELGITDDLEFGLAIGYGLDAVKLEGEPEEVEDGLLDTTVEFRYRFLDEAKDWPVSLTAGPVLLIPTGDEDRGFSLGRVGYGLEAAVGRDFGRVYAGAWIQRIWTHDVLLPEERGHDVHTLQYALTVVGKLLERRQPGGGLAHVHATLDLAGGHNNKIAPAAFTADQTRGRGFDCFAIAPGITYGTEEPDGGEVEIGVAVPIGLNQEADDWGAIFQAEARF